MPDAGVSAGRLASPLVVACTGFSVALVEAMATGNGVASRNFRDFMIYVSRLLGLLLTTHTLPLVANLTYWWAVEMINSKDACVGVPKMAL